MFRSLCQVQVGGKPVDVKWALQKAETDRTNGTRLTLRFAGETPRLEFQFEWWARRGRGPIRHAAFITNKGTKPVTIGYQATISLGFAAPRPAQARGPPQPVAVVFQH